MSPERPQPPTAVAPIASMDDPRVITILSTEHWSLLSARSLAYNEAFVRAGMFLTFLSMSFVAMALLAQAMDFGRDFLSVTALVLAFDLVIGVLAAVVAMLVGANGGASIWIGLVGGGAVLVAMIAYSYVSIESVQASVTARFPTPGGETAPPGEG